MNLIELMAIVSLIFCGGFLGILVAKVITGVFGLNAGRATAFGTLAGSGTTLFGLILWSWWFCKMDKIHPPCRCGRNDWKDFELGRAEGFRNVWQCACGKQYSWPKWQLWFELTSQNDARLFMTRTYFSPWREATEAEVANQPMEIARAKKSIAKVNKPIES